MIVMPTMVSLAQEYLTLRRQLGYALRCPGHALLSFARYADGIGHRGPITLDLAVCWAKLPQDASPCWWARRLLIVRGFAQHRSLFDPATEIPPVGLLGPPFRRGEPHIYSDAEISELMRAAAKLGPPGGLRPHSYVTLFGLLVTSGLRISEALRLDREDVHLKSGVLTVLLTKFRKSRLVPLHASATRVLGEYAKRRDRHHRKSSERRGDPAIRRLAQFSHTNFARRGHTPYEQGTRHPARRGNAHRRASGGSEDRGPDENAGVVLPGSSGSWVRTMSGASSTSPPPAACVRGSIPNGSLCDS